MLPKRSRLKDTSLFQRTFRSGKPFFFEKVACRVLFLNNEPVRIGFSVSKKLFPRAVDRNHIKRLLSAAVYRVYEDIPIGWQIILSPRGKGVLDRDGAEKNISSLIREINNIKT